MQQKIVITPQELEEWKRGKVTKFVLNTLKEECNELSASLARGDTLQGGAGTVEETAKTVGKLQGLGYLLLILTSGYLEADIEVVE